MTMKIFVNGQPLSDADINEYLVNTKFAIKPGPEQRSSSPNLNDDSDLVLHVDASKTYHCQMVIALGSPAAAGFSFAFGAPAGSVLYGIAKTSFGDSGLITHWTPIYDGVNTLFGATIAITTFGGGSTDFVELNAMLVTAGTAGNFKLKWSQTNSNGSNTTVRGGSWLLLTRRS